MMLSGKFRRIQSIPFIFLCVECKEAFSIIKKIAPSVVPAEDLFLMSPASSVVLFCSWCAVSKRSLTRFVAFASCDKID